MTSRGSAALPCVEGLEARQRRPIGRAASPAIRQVKARRSGVRPSRALAFGTASSPRTRACAQAAAIGELKWARQWETAMSMRRKPRSVVMKSAVTASTQSGASEDADRDLFSVDQTTPPPTPYPGHLLREQGERRQRPLQPHAREEAPYARDVDTLPISPPSGPDAIALVFDVRAVPRAKAVWFLARRDALALVVGGARVARSLAS